jgi:type VI secretion system protein ImpK
VDRVTEIARDCLNALSQIREAGEGELPAPEVLHARLRALVDDALHRAAAVGLGREEANDVVYPLVALADEVVLGKGSDELRGFWSAQPLQLLFFNENVAGEAFFTRLEAVRRDPRRAELLRAYYLTLAFGFQGRYRVRGGELELMALVDSVARDLARGRSVDVENLSPAGERPAQGIGRVGRTGLFLWIAGGALGLALVLYLGLRISLASGTSAVVDHISAIATP